MLDNLKRDLKQLIGQNRVEAVFTQLREEVLDSSSGLFNDVIHVEARWRTAQKEGQLGTIDYKEKDLTFNNVNQAILWLIDSLVVSDLHPALRLEREDHIAIPEKHAFTCDRVEQSDTFQLHFYDPPPAEDAYSDKVHFFYLYGDARQDHESLFKRLGLELGGFLENWQKGDYDPGINTTFVHCKPRVSKNPKIFKIQVWKELMARFFEPLNRQQPLLSRTLSDVLASPSLKGFGPDDMVFILLTIDDHNWDSKLTPMVVKSLYEEFCNCSLSEQSPHFFFFFSITYTKENTVVQNEMKEAIANAIHGLPLPDLTPVEKEDVSEWFSRYPVIIPPGMTASTVTDSLFPGGSKLDMLDITVKLKEIIDRHNLRMVIISE